MGCSSSTAGGTSGSVSKKIPKGKPIVLHWADHKDMDMEGQGDVEIIENWKDTHTIE